MFSISFLKYAKIIYLCILVESSLNHCTYILDQFLMGRDLTPLPVASSFGASCKSNSVFLAGTRHTNRNLHST